MVYLFADFHIFRRR